MIPPTVTELIRLLQQKKFNAYLVGGCVRDLVVGRVLVRTGWTAELG